MIKHIEGDLVAMASNGHFGAIIHGCNCRCTMGAGIARQIAKAFPEAALVDDRTRKLKDKLGTISEARVKKRNVDFIVFNAYTQAGFGEGLQVDYNAIRSALLMIKQAVRGWNVKIGLPQIGAGLGGGDWDKILEIIQETLGGEDVTIVHYKKNREQVASEKEWISKTLPLPPEPDLPNNIAEFFREEPTIQNLPQRTEPVAYPKFEKREKPKPSDVPAAIAQKSEEGRRSADFLDMMIEQEQKDELKGPIRRGGPGDGEFDRKYRR